MKEQSVVRRLRAHMEDLLETRPDISTGELAESFRQANMAWLKPLYETLGMNYLRRLASDLLRRRTGIAAEDDNPAFQLPLGFGDIRVATAISYVSMANQERHCLTRKADWFKVSSHLSLMRKQQRDLNASVRDYEKFVALVRPLMQDEPGMTVEGALEALRESVPREDRPFL